MAADDAFEGFDPEELPSPSLDFSCKGNPTTNPDVIVDIKEAGEWVRMPVTHVEMHINKDGPADITRTGQVRFPAEWGGHSIVQYVNGFNAQNPSEKGDPYDECRIFMRDQGDDFWQIAHYGYVGGVGPTTDEGVFKMWVYDPADLMSGIQVSKTFGNPTIAQILEFALNGSDDQGRPVGLNKRSVFEGIQPYLAGIDEVAQQKKDTSTLDLEGGGQVSTEVGVIGGIIGALQIDVEDLVDDIFDYVAGTAVTGGIGAQKTFQLNRHSMVDLMDWFAARVGGKWHFEPTPTGPILFFDNTSAREGTETPDGEIARRVFVEEDIILGGADGVVFENPSEFSGFENRDTYTSIETLNNDALADIKPFNTLFLYGEASNPQERDPQYLNAGTPAVYSESYPRVKVTYTPLLERAGGYEYSAPAVESDEIFLDQAVDAAIEEFRKHISEESEGHIDLKGEPHILPYDYIRTIPVCNEKFPNANANPITYEVNGVTHKRTAGERFTTQVRSSIVFAEEDLAITAGRQEA